MVKLGLGSLVKLNLVSKKDVLIGLLYFHAFIFMYIYVHGFGIYTCIYLSIQVSLLQICKNYIFVSLNHDNLLKKDFISDHYVGHQNGD